MVMYNDGANGFPSGSYVEIPKSNTNTRDYAVRVADVDDNGLKDIITASESGPNFVYKQTSLGVFSAVQLPVSTNSHYGIAVADFNNDSYPDIALSNGNGSAKLLMNDGSGNYPTATDLISGGTGSSIMVTEGDVDNDGDMDLVVCTNRHQPDKLYINDGTGTFTEVILPGSNKQGIAAGCADLDGDGYLDIVIGGEGQLDRILMNDGNGNYPTTVDIQESITNTKIMKFGDIDGDGDIDIVIAEDGSRGHLMLNDGSGNFPSRQVIATGIFEPWGLAVLGSGVVEENGGGVSIGSYGCSTFNGLTSSHFLSLYPTRNIELA